MSEQNLNHEANVLADSLAKLQPLPLSFDRDTLMFRAGQASAKSGWQWPVATIVSSCVAAVLGLALLVRPPSMTHEVERIVYVRIPAPSTSTEPPTPVAPATETAALVTHETNLPGPLTDYQRLQEHLLRWGFDGLPALPQPSTTQETPERLFRSL